MDQDAKKYNYRETVVLLNLWAVWLWGSNLAKLKYPSVSSFYSEVATFRGTGEIQSDSAEKMEKLIVLMPEYYQEPIKCRYHKQMSYREMARKFKVSESTIKTSRLYGGHVWLQSRVVLDDRLLRSARSIISNMEKKPVEELI